MCGLCKTWTLRSRLHVRIVLLEQEIRCNPDSCDSEAEFGFIKYTVKANLFIKISKYTITWPVRSGLAGMNCRTLGIMSLTNRKKADDLHSLSWLAQPVWHDARTFTLCLPHRVVDDKTKAHFVYFRVVFVRKATRLRHTIKVEMLRLREWTLANDTALGTRGLRFVWNLTYRSGILNVLLRCMFKF